MIDLLVATTNPHKLDEVRAVLAPLGVRAVGLAEARTITRDPGAPPVGHNTGGTGAPPVGHNTGGTGVPPVITQSGGTGVPPVITQSGGTGVPPVTEPTAADLPEPAEDADTFAGNAEIKAVFYATRTGRVCLADDSGLEADALAGAPGVRSARYAGIDGSRAERDAANNDKLLRELAGEPRERRGARFVCCMCLAGPDGRVLARSRGEMAGVITESPRGVHGFGYDPLLELPGGRTSAELTPDEKNAVSHRAAATRAIAPAIVRLTATIP